MKTLFTHIKSLNGAYSMIDKPLTGTKLKEWNTLNDAFLLIENEIIVEYGSMSDNLPESDTIINCEGKLILPTYCDSHTHIVFATSREEEFVDRINGLSYEDVAAKGGGILNSAKKLEAKSEDELYEEAMTRLQYLISLGTGAVEIKSGYGLSLEAELKMLRVIKKMKANAPIPVKATFLGAHAIPMKYKSDREKYIDIIINEMIPVVAKENLADYIDVFCESNYFTVAEMDAILKAGKAAGLKPKVHVNQFTSIGGIQNALDNGAISVDHLEVMTEDDLDALSKSNTLATVLPSCSLFINIPYAPAKEIIKAEIPLVLASDYNPGSTPSGNMNLVVSLACIKQRIHPKEAFSAATINGAFAMEVSDKLGSITPGKLANFIITKPVKNLAYLPYSFGENCISEVYINGKKYVN